MTYHDSRDDLGTQDDSALRVADPVLCAVRETIAGRLARPGPDLSRRLATIAPGAAGSGQRSGRRSGRRRWGQTRSVRRLVPAGAAVTVLALMAGAFVLLGPDGPRLGEQITFPAGSGFGEVTMVPPEEVLAAMTAAAAGATPAEPGASQLVFMRTEDAGQDATNYGEQVVRGVWYEPDGMITVAFWTTEPGPYPSDPPDPDDVQPESADLVEEQRQALAQDGPTFLTPTPQWLAGLPTAPAELREQLEEWGIEQLMRGEADGVPAATPVLVALGELLVRGEPVLTVPVRVAMYEVLLGLPGIATGEVDLAGRPWYVVRYEHGTGQVVDLFLDPVSGRFAGLGGSSEQLFDGRYQLAVASYAIVDEVGDIG